MQEILSALVKARSGENFLSFRKNGSDNNEVTERIENADVHRDASDSVKVDLSLRGHCQIGNACLYGSLGSRSSIEKFL